MQISTFIFMLLLFRSKFEREGGFIGICLGLVFVGFMTLIIVGWALYLVKKQKK